MTVAQRLYLLIFSAALGLIGLAITKLTRFTMQLI